MRPQTLLIILGAPRSGTSWLGKIFDSHPGVVYRHEPDSLLRRRGFPSICEVAEIPRHIDAVRRYVLDLTAVRQVKSSGTRPVFRKPFHSLPASLFRRILAYGLRAAESLAPAADWPRRMAIPDFIRGHASQVTYAIKSINLLESAAPLACALPEARIIALYRHPCGQIASLRRGVAGGWMTDEFFGPRFLATVGARQHGLTPERYEGLTPLQRQIWGWALLHKKVFDETVDLRNVRLLRYEDLCRDPVQEAGALFQFAGLPWAPETARFIERSTRGGGRSRYYGLFRDPMAAAARWRSELSPDEIAECIGIVGRVLPGIFPEG